MHPAPPEVRRFYNVGAMASVGTRRRDKLRNPSGVRTFMPDIPPAYYHAYRGSLFRSAPARAYKIILTS